MNYDFWIVTLSLFLVIIITRSLPFLFANLMSKRFNRLGQFLPAYIMLLLVIYEINPATITSYPYAAPAFIALGLLTAIHLLIRNTFLTLIVATTGYILINLMWSRLF